MARINLLECDWCKQVSLDGVDVVKTIIGAYTHTAYDLCYLCTESLKLSQQEAFDRCKENRQTKHIVYRSKMGNYEPITVIVPYVPKEEEK